MKRLATTAATPLPVQSVQPIRSMQEWQKCLSGKVENPQNVDNWQPRKDLIRLRCVQHLTEEDMERTWRNRSE